MKHMVGSYPPKKEIQFYLTPAEEAPSGTFSRGTYSVSSVFTDDDKHIHLEWDWTFEIKRTGPNWHTEQHTTNTHDTQLTTYIIRFLFSLKHAL